MNRTTGRGPSPRRGPLGRRLATLVVVLSTATACGGRYSDAERLAATAGGAAPAAHAAAVGGGVAPAVGPDTAVVPGRTAAGLPAGSAASTNGATAGPGGGTAPPAEGGTASAAVGAKVAASTRAGAEHLAGSGAGGPAPAAGATAGSVPTSAAPPGRPGVPGPSGARSPVKLASIGVRSGVIGSIFIPYYEGAVAWVNDVNRRGGLAGRPVQLIAVDDGGDPRKALAATKRLVEEDRVTAFFAEHAVTTFDSIIPYLEEKGMPVIGSAVPNVDHENTPIFFNVSFSSRAGLVWSHLLPVYLFHPEVKDIGILYCGEAEVCKAMNSDLGTIGPAHGYRIVYRAQVSIAQPDYTAEVLAARNAGAKALILIMDNFSAIRIATSAHRQGYEPFFGIQGSAHSEKFLRDGGKEIEGFLIGGQALHWTSPLLADFVAAYRASVPGGDGLSSFAAASWNSGKLLEKVAPGWPDNPTPADVVASLRALRNETLGGLVPPVTFRAGERAGTLCSCVVRVEGGQFVPFQGRNEYSCAPAPGG